MITYFDGLAVVVGDGLSRFSWLTEVGDSAHRPVRIANVTDKPNEVSTSFKSSLGDALDKVWVSHGPDRGGGNQKDFTKLGIIPIRFV